MVHEPHVHVRAMLNLVRAMYVQYIISFVQSVRALFVQFLSVASSCTASYISDRRRRR